MGHSNFPGARGLRQEKDVLSMPLSCSHCWKTLVDIGKWSTSFVYLVLDGETVPQEAMYVVKEIYQGSEVKASSESDLTAPSPGSQAGMSSEPSVFNLATEGLLWCIVNCLAKGYSVSEVLKFKSMAYADDLAIVNQTVKDTEVMIARFC